MTHTIALSGDTVLSEQVSDRVDSKFQQLHELLRDTDVAHTHMEAMPQGRDTESYPARRTIGGWLTAPDGIGQEFDRLGFDIVTLPGNHTFDHSYAGLFAAWETLDTAGVEHVGTGWDLNDAREPEYVEAGGATVAFVSATSSFYGEAVAGQSAHGDRRPGVNPLRWRNVVGRDDWEEITTTAHKRGQSAIERDDDLFVRPPGRNYPIEQFRLEPGLAPGDNYTEVIPRDRRELTDAVDQAGRNADTVIVHVHAHEYAVGSEMVDPPSFIRQFAHDVVDAGAHAVVSQGTHMLRGVELYDGAPVFYDLNGLFRMRSGPPYPRTERLRVDPGDDYEPVNLDDEEDDYLGGVGILPVLTAGTDGIEAIELRAVRRDEGVPRLLDDSDIREVVTRLEALSERFGTTISTDGGLGRIQLD